MTVSNAPAPIGKRHGNQRKPRVVDHYRPLAKLAKSRFGVLWSLADCMTEQLDRSGAYEDAAVIWSIDEPEGPRYDQVLAGMASTAARRSLTRRFHAVFHLLSPNLLFATSCEFFHRFNTDEWLMEEAGTNWLAADEEAQTHERAYAWLKEHTFASLREQQSARTSFSTVTFRPEDASGRSERELMLLLSVHPYRLVLERKWRCRYVYQHPNRVGIAQPGAWSPAYRSFISFDAQAERLCST